MNKTKMHAHRDRQWLIKDKCSHLKLFFPHLYLCGVVTCIHRLAVVVWSLSPLSLTHPAITHLTRMFLWVGHLIQPKIEFSYHFGFLIERSWGLASPSNHWFPCDLSDKFVKLHQKFDICPVKEDLRCLSFKCLLSLPHKRRGLVDTKFFWSFFKYLVDT